MTLRHDYNKLQRFSISIALKSGIESSFSISVKHIADIKSDAVTKCNIGEHFLYWLITDIECLIFTSFFLLRFTFAKYLCFSLFLLCFFLFVFYFFACLVSFWLSFVFVVVVLSCSLIVGCHSCGRSSSCAFHLSSIVGGGRGVMVWWIMLLPSR